MRKQIFQRKTQFIDRKSGFIGEKPGFRILLNFACHKCNLKQNLVCKLRIQKLVPSYAIMVMFSSWSFTGLSISFKCLLDANFRHVKSYCLGRPWPPRPPSGSAPARMCLGQTVKVLVQRWRQIFPFLMIDILTLNMNCNISGRITYIQVSH